MISPPHWLPLESASHFHPIDSPYPHTIDPPPPPLPHIHTHWLPLTHLKHTHTPIYKPTQQLSPINSMHYLQLKSEKGRLYLIPSIARTELDDVIELIRTKCDLVHHGDEKTEIMTTGAGCNLFKSKLEEGLDIRYLLLVRRTRLVRTVECKTEGKLV